MTAQTVPAQFVLRIAESARSQGYDPDQWCTPLGVDLARLDPEADEVGMHECAALVRELWRTTDDELWGLGPAPIARGMFELIGLVVVHAPDLAGVLDRFQQMTSLLPNVPTFASERSGDTVRLTIDLDLSRDPQHLAIDALLSMSHRFLGWLVGHRIRLHVVELPYPRPAVLAGYETLFGAPLRFDAPVASFSFDADLLSLPVLQTEESMAEYAAQAPVNLMRRRDWGSAASDRVRKVLQRGLQGEWPTPDEVAARLSMSPQNMRRLLREEGTSLTQIKEELLRDAAIASLTAGRESVTALSERLGFSEPSAFNRAFRRWTGSAPTSYRRHRADPGADPTADSAGG